MYRSRVKVLAALAGSVLLAGCATTAKDEALRGELDEIRAIAEQAAADAAAARQQAASAQSSADAARASADQARAQSADTDARIDRMFKKAMYK
jgi:murein lipoprotein